MKKPWLWQAQTWTCKLQPSHSILYAWFHFKFIYTHKHNLVSNSVVILCTTKHPGSELRVMTCYCDSTSGTLPCPRYNGDRVSARSNHTIICTRLLTSLCFNSCIFCVCVYVWQAADYKSAMGWLAGAAVTRHCIKSKSTKTSDFWLPLFVVVLQQGRVIHPALVKEGVSSRPRCFYHC